MHSFLVVKVHTFFVIMHAIFINVHSVLVIVQALFCCKSAYTFHIFESDGTLEDHIRPRIPGRKWPAYPPPHRTPMQHIVSRCHVIPGAEREL